MSRLLSRRDLLLAPLGLLALSGPAQARGEARNVSVYRVDVGVLFDFITFEIGGTVTEQIDHAAGRYQVTITGEGTGVSSRTQAFGVIRDDRFMPVETTSFHTVRGRESRLSLRFDYGRRVVEYRAVGHTLLLGRRREVDDVIPLGPAEPVDDLISAGLNFAANRLPAEPDGTYRTAVVRRARPRNEGPDDISSTGYRAEIVPLRFQPVKDPGTGRLTALLDLTRLSSWARPEKPARVVFGPDRRVVSIESSLILGTRFHVRLDPSS
jgi:hypothetical protein